MESKQHKPWHAMSYEDVERALDTSEKGLSDAEAAKRLAEYGKNNLREKKAKSVWKMIWEQLTDVMVIILLIAAAFSLVMHFWQDEGLAECIVILVVIALNATIGVIQEKKAANALEALKNMTAPTARVLREGEESVVPASEIVPGDIVYLEDGCIVPADIRIIEDNNMKVQEAALTGESVPAEKDGPTILPENAPLGDRVNMAYSSSIVMYGNATGIVVGTGMNTEVGKIAGLLEEQDDTDTPMKRKLNSVGKALSLVGLIVCVVIFAIGLIRDGWSAWVNYVFIAISLAISIIPEGLPATSTIIMALGVQRMAKKNALVKSLPAVETLGGATVVCCDKTGTLTLNKMTVTHVALGNDFIEGYATKTEELSSRYPEAVYRDMLAASALCVNAKKDPDNPGNILGDPTEGALVLLAEKFGIDAEDYEEAHERVFEQPFDSDRKRMTTLNRAEEGLVAYTKGAVDEMLPLCTRYQTADGVRDMTDADREKILELCNRMSSEALRVLGFAKRVHTEVPEDEAADIESGMTFIGVTGMIDPPRKEVIKAVETCHEAGIRVVMITGDHKVTAMAIAKQLHIFREGNIVISGQELDEMSDEELDKAVEKCVVFARVSPSDKLRIIQSLKRCGEVAAMTGDGVNDSPALKEADRIRHPRGQKGVPQHPKGHPVPRGGQHRRDPHPAAGRRVRVGNAHPGGAHPAHQPGHRLPARRGAGRRPRQPQRDEAQARQERHPLRAGHGLPHRAARPVHLGGGIGGLLDRHDRLCKPRRGHDHDLHRPVRLAAVARAQPALQHRVHLQERPGAQQVPVPGTGGLGGHRGARRVRASLHAPVRPRLHPLAGVAHLPGALPLPARGGGDLQGVHPHLQQKNAHRLAVMPIPVRTRAALRGRPFCINWAAF